MKTGKILRLMSMLLLTIASMAVISSCGDDGDEPNPNPGSNDDLVGQTIMVNNKRWYVGNSSSVTAFSWASYISVYVAKEKEGLHGSANLSFHMYKVLIPDNYKSGETLNGTFESSRIGLDNVTSYELSYESGKIIYQEYNAETNIITLQLDKITFSYNGSEKFCIDGEVKLKYNII